MRKRYSGKDVRNWKVVDFHGKVIPFHTTVFNEEEKKTYQVTILRFSGYRDAARAAKKLGRGTPVRE